MMETGRSRNRMDRMSGRHSRLYLLLCFFLLTMLLPQAAAESTANRRENIMAATQKWFASHPTGRVYIQTDKPLYKPGEVIWFKTSVFDTRSLSTIKTAYAYTCRLTDPRGSVMATKYIRLQNGTGENDIVIPPGIPGGEYLLKIQIQGGPAEERPIIINAYKAPLIKKKLDILGKAYGPGDLVTADAQFWKGTGEQLSSHPVTIICMVDGTEVKRFAAKTDDEGRLHAKVRLPDEINEDNAFLIMKISQGGLTESISRGIPILLQKLNMEFFPEGGDMVENLPIRIYFQATKPDGRPARVEGTVYDDIGGEVTQIRSTHHGMGRFDFRPLPGRTYHLRVTRPSTISRRFPLPAAVRDGIVMRVSDDFSGEYTRCRIGLHCTRDYGDVTIVASLRENILSVINTDLSAGTNRLDLFPGLLQGVMRISVLDKKGLPLCERLVYRGRGLDMQVKIRPDKDHYMPREKVTLHIETSLYNGLPCRSELGLSVVDDRVLAYADDKTAHILSHLYLEKDLPGRIEEPNFYLNADKEDSALALELLMGTRGWRRFTWARVLDPGKKDVRVADELFGEALARVGRKHLYKKLKPKAALRKGEKADAGPALDPDAVMHKPMPVQEGLARADAKNRLEDEGREMNFRFRGPKDKEAKLMADIVMEVAAEEMDDLRDVRKRQQGGYALIRRFPRTVYKTTRTRIRNDFRETVFWAPRVQTDARGRATVEFYLDDSVTSFRVRAEGTADQGLPGRGEHVIDSRTPMHIEAKLPVALSAGDRIDLPVRFTNETGTALSITGAITIPDFLKPAADGGFPASLTVAANSASTIYVPFTASAGAGMFNINAAALGLSDTIKQTIRVEPVGFPGEFSFSGSLTGAASIAADLPEQLVPGSIKAKVSLYPTPLATVLSGLESILRTPHGCFEQASSSTYPNIMVLMYLRNSGALAPDIEKRAAQLIEQGYRKLTGYECPKKGYEWFGGNPGHEALTAYGLMEFMDMAKVYDKVDTEMIKRTTKWILAQRNGKGGFKRNKRALDSFGRAPADITDAYIVWALSEAGVAGIGAEVDQVVKAAYNTSNPYLMALALLAEANLRPDSGDIPELLSLLEKKGGTSGIYKGVGRSITSSSGQYMDIETTSLTIMARLKAGRPASAVAPSIQWLMKNRQGGGFGPTQSTILALKALVAYANASRVMPYDGDITVHVNGSVAKRLSMEQGQQGVIEITGLERYLTSGHNDIDIKLFSQGELPYSVDIAYKTLKPASNSNSAIDLTIAAGKSRAEMGGAVEVQVKVANATAQGQGMVLARIGIPAGLSPQIWQLKELRKKGVIDFFETTSREVILYFRSMAPRAVKTVDLQLKADIPGQFTGIASCAYLYYNPKARSWVDPIKIEIHKP